MGCEGGGSGRRTRLFGGWESRIGFGGVRLKWACGPRELEGLSGFRVQGSGCRIQGSGCRVQGSGFRVQGSMIGGADSVGIDGGEGFFFFIITLKPRVE